MTAVESVVHHKDRPSVSPSTGIFIRESSRIYGMEWTQTHTHCAAEKFNEFTGPFVFFSPELIVFDFDFHSSLMSMIRSGPLESSKGFTLFILWNNHIMRARGDTQEGRKKVTNFKLSLNLILLINNGSGRLFSSSCEGWHKNLGFKWFMCALTLKLPPIKWGWKMEKFVKSSHFFSFDFSSLPAWKLHTFFLSHAGCCYVCSTLSRRRLTHHHSSG